MSRSILRLLGQPKGYTTLLIIGVVAFFPQIVENPFILHLVIMILFYAALGAAWNIIGGFAGQLSLGHAAFFGLGAYSCVLLNLYTGLNPWLGMIVGVVITSVFAAVISYPCFRLHGPFFTLATIAFAEVLPHPGDLLQGVHEGVRRHHHPPEDGPGQLCLPG